jgi:hypothetical protein
MTAYTDTAVQEAANSPRGDSLGLVCHPRQAQVLLTVPEAVRGDLMAEAHTMQNYIGGNLSGCLSMAAAAWLRSGRFPYRQRAAEHRQAEQAANAAARAANPGAARIILPMN